MLTPEGHRGWLRSRFNDNSLSAFEDHEVLELLLTYAIPRKDTKPIPRLVVEAALRHKAARVVFAHNHPGGSARPSDDDVEVTNVLCRALGAIGIPVVDHVIVAGPKTFSFAEAGMLPSSGDGP
jgi:DNA repair protein RadC